MRRIGRIRFTRDFIQMEESMQMFEWLGMAPIDTKCNFMTGINEVIGLSRHFDEVAIGEIVPNYEILATEDEDGKLSFSANKVEIDYEDYAW